MIPMILLDELEPELVQDLDLDLDQVLVQDLDLDLDRAQEVDQVQDLETILILQTIIPYEV